MSGESEALIRRYYAAFNNADWQTFISCLSSDVAHDINQGVRETGIDKFAEFLTRMDRCYSEQVVDLVVMASPDGRRASAEFTVLGLYKATDTGLPSARGQHYRIKAGAFFEISERAITRVSNYYNVQEWLLQVSSDSDEMQRTNNAA